MVAAKKANLKASTETSTAISAPPGPLAMTIGDRKGLASVLRTISSVADPKSTMPILSHVLIRTDRDGTTFTATDLDTSVTYRAPAWFGGQGARVIPAKPLFDLISRLPRHDVEIRGTEHEGLCVESGKVRSSILGLNDRDFPKVPDCDGVEWHTCDVAALQSVIRGASAAICMDQTRFHLNGLYLEASEGILRGVATDGHRLHKAQAHTSMRLDKGLIVPTKPLRILAKTLTVGMCEIGVRGVLLFVRQGGWTFAIKTVDAQFPPYDQVIPTDRTAFVTVDRRNFIMALDRAKLRSTDARGVKFSAADNEFVVVTEDPDSGTTSERFPCEFTGKSVVFGACARYLIDALKTFDDDRVTFSIGTELDPVLIRGAEDMGTRSLASSAIVCVVMPMRI